MILAFVFVTGQKFTPLFHYWSGEQVSVMVYKKLFEKNVRTEGINGYIKMYYLK